MALKFYKCETCGDVVIKAFSAGEAADHGFGGKQELVANTTEAAFEKHLPVVTVGETVHVTVGEVEHPMMDAHFITFIALETEKGFQVAQLAPGAKPEADFVVADGDKPMAAYEYCNLHGLWKTEI